MPAVLHGKHEATGHFNNLGAILAYLPVPCQRRVTAALRLAPAIEIDLAIGNGPVGWKGDETREAQVLNALFPPSDRNREATRALFEHHEESAGLLMAETIQLGEIAIAVTRKDVKHVHLLRCIRLPAA